MEARLFKLCLISSSVLLVTACGSDDKKNEAPTISSNIAASYAERSDVNIAITLTDKDGSIKSSNVVQSSGPTVNFTYANGSLSFTAPEVTVDSSVAFTVTATDNDNAQSTLNISTNIADVNRAPLVNLNKVDVEFNQLLEFDLGITDPDGDDVQVTITTAPESGELTLLDDNRFTYAPSLNNTSDQQFEITSSDGDLTTTSIINIDLIDTSAPVIQSYTPELNAKMIAASSQIEIAFDDVLAADSLTVNSDTTCSGNIQLSNDDFVTCAPISLATTSTDTSNTVVTLTPSEALAYARDYQLKVTNSVTNFHGTALSEETSFSFRTENQDLLISEVSSSKWWDDNRWVEVYNGTANPISLANYQIVAESINYNDWSDTGIRAFALSDKTLAPGEFMVLQAKHGNGYWQQSVAESAQLMLISDESNIHPEWYYAGGFVELQTATGTTIDFVSFGENAYLPTDETQWLAGTNASAMEENLGMSVVRSQLDADTNSAQDWQVSYYMTPGGQNDVACNTDEDNDGIPDCAEQEGATFAGLPLYEWGARVGQRDLFIEVDYMESNDPGVQLHRQALDSVKAAFAAQNIAVHFDAGDLFHQAEGISPADYDLAGGNQVAFYAQTNFIGSEQAPSVLDHKVKNFDIKRRPIFHYMLMANSQSEDGSAGSSGYAEINGNDFIITMGNWGFSLDTEIDRNIVYNMQAGTIMHELGHNLGLGHGGNNHTNNKPNHYSVMNYLYQLNGLSTIGDNEGDRYHRRFYYGNANCFPDGKELTYGFTSAPSDFKISYSHGTNATIDEMQIDESLGLANPQSNPVDFDCNGNSSDTLVNFDLNNDGRVSSDLNDFDEWSNLVLDFTRYWSGANGGATLSTHEQQKPQNVMDSDVQEIIVEQAPSKALLKMISTAGK